MPPIDKQTCNELKENLNPWILQWFYYAVEGIFSV